jgi:hypothetical protein
MLDSERRTCFFGQAEMCLEFSGNAIAVDMIGPARLVLGVKKSLARTQTPAQAQADEHRATGGGSGGGGGGEQQQPQEEVEEERGEGEWWARYEHYDFIPPMPTQVVKSLLWGKRRHSYKGDVVVACSRTGYFAHLHFCEEVRSTTPNPQLFVGQFWLDFGCNAAIQLTDSWCGWDRDPRESRTFCAARSTTSPSTCWWPSSTASGTASSRSRPWPPPY